MYLTVSIEFVFKNLDTPSVVYIVPVNVKDWLHRGVAYQITVYKLQKGSSKNKQILIIKHAGCNLYLAAFDLYEFDCFMGFFFGMCNRFINNKYDNLIS